MSYLLDTNVLLRLAQPNHPMHLFAIDAITLLRQQQVFLYIFPQTLIEFWTVATRPLNVNGRGISVTKASQEVAQIKQFFPLQPDTPEIFPIWERLIVQHQVMGKQAHDTRLVAAMITHHISHLLTFNTKDFKRFTEITAIDPREVLMQGAVEED
jgi:predicted nucleic acid-binding protein